MDDSKFLIVGANGQLGRALQAKYPNATPVDLAELDISNREAVDAFDWSGVEWILNAAAFTNVDGAESQEARPIAWKVNATAVANLARVAQSNNMGIFHVSTDYVFDGTNKNHTEIEDFAPLSVYGASKAAGDLAASMVPKHYILRTSWVIGEGKNFVRTMLDLGAKGVSPTVVHDQVGRLTFATELVRAIDHLLSNNAEAGTYNITNNGESASWADITREIFELAGYENLTVSNTTTEEYYASKTGIAPRPLNSTMDLTKIESTGFECRDWRDNLKEYISKQ